MSGSSTVALRLPEVNGSVADRLSVRLREYAAGKKLILGVSGGVDSATTLALCVKSVGPENVLGLIMPDTRTTPRADIEDAEELLTLLRVNHVRHNIDTVVDTFRDELDAVDAKLLGNIKARIRMTILYYYANKLDGLVVGTGDRSELLLGYFTKYGDGGVDVLPLGSLYKTQVRRLGDLLGVPPKIVNKPSSPALWVGQTAEGELGVKYEVADLILYAHTELGYQERDLIRLGFDSGVVSRVIGLVTKSAHKRLLPPIL
ncbi:MAG: NAD+ synthase [Thermoprotei archaeon]